MNRRKGFTLIELILVIAILGILAISALPKFLDVSTEASRASRDGVVGAVRAGIALYRANDMVTSGVGPGAYPTTLDSNGDLACTTCFSEILANGVNDVTWSKSGNVYTHAVGGAYTYDNVNGTFAE